MSEKFTAKDASGTAHSYELDTHPGDEGMPIAVAIIALFVEPLASALGPIAMSKAIAAGASGLLDDPSILEGIDTAALGRGLKTCVQGMTMPLMLDVLRYTNRDGKPLVESGRATSMFREGYAKNYMELATAVFEVCKRNGFFPALDSLSSAGKAALAASRVPTKSSTGKRPATES